MYVFVKKAVRRDCFMCTCFISCWTQLDLLYIGSINYIFYVQWKFHLLWLASSYVGMNFQNFPPVCSYLSAKLIIRPPSYRHQNRALSLSHIHTVHLGSVITPNSNGIPQCMETVIGLAKHNMLCSIPRLPLQSSSSSGAIVPYLLPSASVLQPQHLQPNQFTHIQQSNRFHNVSVSMSESEGKLLSIDLWNAMDCLEKIVELCTING